MRISDWSSDVCSSDLERKLAEQRLQMRHGGAAARAGANALSRFHHQHQRGRGVRIGFQRQVRIGDRSEEHTSELQSLMRNSYAVFCLKKKNNNTEQQPENK